MVSSRKRTCTFLSSKTIQKPQENKKTKETNTDSSHTDDMAGILNTIATLAKTGHRSHSVPQLLHIQKKQKRIYKNTKTGKNE